MKTLRKLNVKGFSLIELMVVVAIIGILSAIAIPNFQRFQRKARQSEAKASLGGLYTAQKAFLAEWESYHSDLDTIGLSLDGQLRYNVGFAAGNAPCAFTAGAVPACHNVVGTYTGVSSGGGNFNSAAACGGAAMPDCTDLSSAEGITVSVAPALGPAVFTAGARSPDIGAGTPDEWSINQSKVVLNPTSGL